MLLETNGRMSSGKRTKHMDIRYFFVKDRIARYMIEKAMEELVRHKGTQFDDRVVDNGSNVQPEDDHTPDPGHICFVTGNGSEGGAAGENDVDGGKTTLLSPVFDVTGGSDLYLSYWRWYTNNLGNNPNADEWVVQVSSDGGLSWVDLQRYDEALESLRLAVESGYPKKLLAADPHLDQIRNTPEFQAIIGG